MDTLQPDVILATGPGNVVEQLLQATQRRADRVRG